MSPPIITFLAGTAASLLSGPAAQAEAAGKSRVEVKVWKRGEPEPAEWTATAEDPLPIPAGAPGLYGFSPSPIYYDNISVTRNQTP